jgi:hypothetical protein
MLAALRRMGYTKEENDRPRLPQHGVNADCIRLCIEPYHLCAISRFKSLPISPCPLVGW